MNVFDLVKRVNSIPGNTSETFAPRLQAMQTAYQLEELAEKLETIGLSKLVSFQMRELSIQIRRGDWDLAFIINNLEQRKQLLDDDLDLIWVTIGSVHTQGIRCPDIAFDILADANLAKFPNGVVTKTPDGKWIKPEGWTAPDFSPFICREECQKL